MIEFARNVLHLEGAHTAECETELEHPVIIDMPEHNTGQMGGTMRLGKRVTVFKDASMKSKISKYVILAIVHQVIVYCIKY